MKFDLLKLKSAKVITDPDQISNIFHNRAEALGGTKMLTDIMPQTHIGQEGSITKSARFDGAPPKPGIEELRSLMSKRSLNPHEGFELRILPYWASDESVDSYGDIVLQNWDFSIFDKRSPLLNDHEWNMPPIGRVIDWKVATRKTKEYEGDALWLLNYFAPASVSERADSIFRLVNANVLQSGSVGFRPGRVIRVEDPDERAKLGLGQYGVVLDNNTLLEFSTTSLGANTSAEVLRSHKSQLKPFDLMMLREINRRSIAQTTRKKDYLKASEWFLVSLARSFWPEMKNSFVPHIDLDSSILLDDKSMEIEFRADVSDESMGAINEKLDALQTWIEQSVGAVKALVEEIRDNLGSKKPEEETPPGEETPPVDPETSEEVKRMLKNLELVDKE